MAAVAILLFSLDQLRARYGHLVPAGADPRHDTTPFRAFRAELLQALAAATSGRVRLGMWWEGGFNGYALAVAAEPADAVPQLEQAASVACEVEAFRLGAPRRDGHPLATVEPGRWEVARDEQGAAAEPPFGAPAGHFGAPGMRRMA